MCGIAGVFSKAGVDPALLNKMGRLIAHRGPDDDGTWQDHQSGIGLAHRRLAVVDLTNEGHQPMHSADGRFVITFNGEIYNHLQIKAELNQSRQAPDSGWKGHSDTEVLLQSIAAWGLDKALERAIGMFAFALWDRREGLLQLVRDRFGEKPLYYGSAGSDFIFASELKALKCHPKFDARIDRRSLAAFVARTYVPAPFSIYSGIFKLPPASVLTISAEALNFPIPEPVKEVASGALTLKRYWSYRQLVQRGLDDPFTSEEETVETLESSLSQAVRTQSLADVPVGAFLSGGIDSSTIVALHQKLSSKPLRTYSIGFEQAGYDEAGHAKAIAAHLGTIHHEHYVTMEEARYVIPLLPAIYDEPFGDSSQIPTFLVSRFTRSDVTVALTGDGGDELFGGYNRHIMAPGLWRQLQKLPRPLRAVVAGPLGNLPAGLWSGAASLLGVRSPFAGARIRKGLRAAGASSKLEDFYGYFLDEWALEQSPVLMDAKAAPFDFDIGQSAPDAVRMMYCDALSYLPDDILCKVDRASMAVSLETRLPFLDHHVAGLAAKIPIELKVRGGRGKHILRKLLTRHVPGHLFDRPKAGFAIPVGEWIKGPLRPWAEDLLDPRRMAQDGWLDPSIVQRRWRDHLAGRRDSTPAIWALLMFQAWMREQGSTGLMAG